jgi:hypothetical protein
MAFSLNITERISIFGEVLRACQVPEAPCTCNMPDSLFISSETQLSQLPFKHTSLHAAEISSFI